MIFTRFRTLAAALIAASAPLHAADITLHASAIDAGLRKEVFRAPGGRYVLSGDLQNCNYAYLEKPATRLHEGRIHVRMHFTAQVGVERGASCVGHVEAFWVTVSGRPYFRGELLGVNDVRLEEGRELAAPMLQDFLAATVPRAINVNLRQELTRILAANSPPYQVSLTRLEMQGLAAERDMLRVKFDFSLEGR